MRRVTAFVCMALAVSVASADEPATWYTIVADSGATLGHVSLQVAARADGRDLIESQQIYLRERGGVANRTTTRTVVREEADGRVSSIESTARTGRSWSRTNATVGANRVDVVRETPTGSGRESVALPADIRFDDGEALLQSWTPASTPRLEFTNFDSDSMAVERIVIEPLGAADAQGRINAVRWRYEGQDLRGVSRIALEHGRLVEVAQPMFGETFRVRLTDRTTAERRHPPYQVIPNMAQRAPFQISQEARRGHIRYRYAFREGVTFPLPQTGEQRARTDGAFITLDICDACGPGLPTDEAYLAAARRSTTWLQSDHPRLQAMAAAARGYDVSDARKMEVLLQRAIPYLEEADFNGHYSALDTLERRKGDCTEAAVLLAALGRAAGIPTRVASGVSYSRQSYHGVSNAFIPHSWVVAYVDGHWRSFDLALREFDSAHIALTIGDGDPRSIAAAGQLASLLRLDTMAEVRARPAG
ncbi:MAG: transglutaminase domain-containing protein [Caulobacteraceae bacterium]|nr:transglutaminase domain-containing protein [Caulobacteraceae bacterium]